MVEAPLSRERYLLSTLPIETRMTADKLTKQLATRELERYQEPHMSIRGITLNMGPDPKLWQTVLGLELGDVVTVRRRPPGGGPLLSQVSRIERIRHDFDTTPGRRW